MCVCVCVRVCIRVHVCSCVCVCCTFVCMFVRDWHSKTTFQNTHLATSSFNTHYQYALIKSICVLPWFSARAATSSTWLEMLCNSTSTPALFVLYYTRELGLVLHKEEAKSSAEWGNQRGCTKLCRSLTLPCYS